jgi:hypothetical protein
MEKRLINISTASEILTGNTTQIRHDYKKGKYLPAINELREFEKQWRGKHGKR